MSNRARLVASLVLALVAPVGSAIAQSLSWTATYDSGSTWANSAPGGPHGIEVDSQGIAYAVGRRFAGTVPGNPSVDPGADVLIKLGVSGPATWSRDLTVGRPSVLVLDELGRPTVTGALASEKYDAAGVRLWRVSHDFGVGRLEASASAAAPNGGIYLAGWSTDAGSGGRDLAVARLDGAGRLVWMRLWDGPLHLDDEGQALGVDSAGRIYVTGPSVREPSSGAFAQATVCVDAEGALLWARVLDEPLDGARAAFAVDLAGGVFLAVPFAQGPADWRALKYDAAGALLWSREFRDAFDSDQAIPEFAATSPDGGVYVAARSTTGRPELVRYSAAGAEQWASVGADFVTGAPGAPESGLRVDSGGRASVVRTLGNGKLRASVYEASGAVAWSRDLEWIFYEPPDPYVTPSSRVAGLALTTAGEMRIAAGSSLPQSRLIVLACDGSGVVTGSAGPPQWPPDEGALATRLDAAGSTVVLATAFSFSQTSIRTLKYASDGGLLWTRESPGSLPQGLALGPAGEAVAVGVLGTGPATQFVAVKYDADGDQIWTRTYTPPGFPSWPGATGVVVDGSGSVYVVGVAQGVDTREFVLKYSADGSLLWVRQSPLASQAFPERPLVALTPTGNIVVAANVAAPYHLFVLDPAGNLVWSAVGEPGGTTPTALAVDLLGNVILGLVEGRVVKLGPTGAPIWTVDPGPGMPAVAALSVDGGGEVSVAHSFRPPGPGGPCSVSRYSSAGVRLWVREVDGGPVTQSNCRGIRSGSAGTVYVGGGYQDATLGAGQAFVMAYDAAGQLRWARSYAGDGGGQNAFNDLDAGPAGRVVAAGYAHSSATGYDVLTQSIVDDPAPPLAFHTVSPCRAFDSRDLGLGGPAAVAANAPFEAPLAGRCGVPATARSVALNVTVTGAGGAGHLTLFPAGRVPPPTSTINYAAGVTRATQAVVAPGDGGRVTLRAIQASGSVHVILDVSGYFE